METALGCSLPLSIPTRRHRVDLFAGDLDDEEEAAPPRSTGGRGDSDADDGERGGGGDREHADAMEDDEGLHVQGSSDAAGTDAVEVTE